jgi:hypothetical protein
VINEELMAFMQALDTREIHGYRPELGFRVFTEAALRGEETPTKAMAGKAGEIHRASESYVPEERDALHQAPEVK